MGLVVVLLERAGVIMEALGPVQDGQLGVYHTSMAPPTGHVATLAQRCRSLLLTWLGPGCAGGLGIYVVECPRWCRERAFSLWPCERNMISPVGIERFAP